MAGGADGDDAGAGMGDAEKEAVLGALDGRVGIRFRRGVGRHGGKGDGQNTGRRR
jgi:hypothetical protein